MSTSPSPAKTSCKRQGFRIGDWETRTGFSLRNDIRKVGRRSAPPLNLLALCDRDVVARARLGIGGVVEVARLSDNCCVGAAVDELIAVDRIAIARLAKRL